MQFPTVRQSPLAEVVTLAAELDRPLVNVEDRSVMTRASCSLRNDAPGARVNPASRWTIARR